MGFTLHATSQAISYTGISQFTSISAASSFSRYDNFLFCETRRDYSRLSNYSNGKIQLMRKARNWKKKKTTTTEEDIGHDLVNKCILLVSPEAFA